MGTVTYMSPEQSTAEYALDSRSDQYSLALVLYEMRVGEPPFTGSTAQIITRRITEPPPPLAAGRPGVPVRVERAVSRALERVPGDRFPSLADWARELELSGT
ncbi:MAG TPA: hypothetical protein VGP61_13100, partial [Gemmatimonadales bacterium]|nr:hypothetical protein [Gemmatimonadales bacterium]